MFGRMRSRPLLSLGSLTIPVLQRLKSTKMSNAAACIIANEVLNGKTLDTNSNFLAKECFKFGLNLGHIRVIPDERQIISETVRELSEKFDLVFTSGGIGPTHDDMTYESIATAFNRPMKPHDPTMQLMKEYTNSSSLNEGQLRMATFPEPDEVIVTPGLWVPLVRVKNVLILPGVPRLFQMIVSNWLANNLNTSGLHVEKKTRILIKTMWKESILAAKLEELQEEVTPYGIDLGSYPKMVEKGTSFVVLSVVGPEKEANVIKKITDRIVSEFDGTEISSSSTGASTILHDD